MSAVSFHPIFALLVDADSDRAHALDHELRAAATGPGPTLNVEVAGDLRAALARLAQGGVDVVLLDLMLPDSQGVATFDQAHAFAPDMPIVVLSDQVDEAVALSTVQAGAQDYLIRAEGQGPLLLRSIRYAIERNRLLSALRSLALIDDLTGLYNRRGFMELGAQFLKLTRRSGREGTLLCVDLNRFRDVNGRLGHHLGDRLLQRVAGVLRGTFRRSDLVARVRGDRFAVLAPAAPAEPVGLLAGRVLDGLSGLDGGDELEVRASVGWVSTGADAGADMDTLLSMAESEMLAQRQAGAGAGAR